MSMRSVVEAGLCQRSLQIDYDEDVVFQAEQKIHDLARDSDGKPFFLAASFTHPHNPFTITPEYWDRYDHDDIDLPKYPGKPVEARDPWSQRYYHVIRQDEHEVTDAHIRNARHAYLRHGELHRRQGGEVARRARRHGPQRQHRGGVHGRPRRDDGRAGHVVQIQPLRVVRARAVDRPGAGQRQGTARGQIPSHSSTCCRRCSIWRPTAVRPI